ncbi:MAG: stage V sporulation protein AA [Lachnospiraceae bacterium]
MAVTKETLYIKAERNVEVTKPEVTLGDVLTITGSNPEMISKIKILKLVKMQEKGQRRCVISILKIIECIQESYPSVEMQNMGETDFIITYENQKTPNLFLYFLKVITVMAITFFGAAFSIMAFNNDVAVTRMFAQIYTLLTGRATDGFTILELTYCIGLTVGILVFFNHFGGKKFSADPTPMEVEMRLYENDIQTTLIENYSRKEQELDVGNTNTSGNHRS